MFRTHPRHPEPEQLENFLTILNQHLLLEEHLAEGQLADSDVALIFYQATGFYHLLKRELERAVFAINQATALDPQNPLLAMTLMAFTAITVENPERARQLRDFLLPLMASK